MHERKVRDLADAVLDGEEIDWPAAWARLDPHEQTLAAQLRTLSRLGTTRHAPPVRPSRRLPWLLEVGRGLAVVVTISGLLSEVLAISQIASGRLGVLLALTVIFSTAAFVLDWGGKDRRARALAACYWTMSAAVATPGLLWLAREYPTMYVPALLAGLHPDAFFAATLWQFGRDFPVLTRFGAIDRFSLVAVRVTLFIATLLVTVNIVPVLVPSAAEWLAPLQRRNGYVDWFWNLTFLAAAPAIGVIAWRGRSATGQEAARVRLFLFTLAFCVLPVVVEVLAEGLVPPFAQLMKTPAGQWWGAVLVYTPIFVLPFATAYAVAVDNVLEVRVVIQRAVRYLLARWIIMWGAAVPLAFLVIYMVRESSRPLGDVMADPMARALMWAGALALVLLMLRRQALRALDRWILPGIDDASAILAQLTERMRQARTPLEVTALLARAAERTLQTPAQAYRAIDDVLMPIDGNAAPLPAQSLVRVVLEGSREPCVVSHQQRHSYFWLLSDRDRSWISEAGIVMLLPVVSSRAGGLVGMVTLTERRNALAFSSDDMRFLRAATGAAALACDLVHSPQLTAGDQFEEFGLECTRCGRVEARTASPASCACGLREWATAALPKQLHDRFAISRRLGAGGMGIVYGGTDLRLGREVAVKTLTRLSDEAAQRLMVEARAMADLAHPNIAVLYGAEIWRGTPLLIMEYMAEGTLATALQKRPMPQAVALRYVKELAAALVHVHRLNQYHGDIKPSNIGFTRDGAIKFLDFGLSRAIVTPLDRHHDDEPLAGSLTTVAGTWAYMSPEVREGAPPGPALDVWAMTVVLFECVAGKHPFAGPSRWEASVDVSSALRLLPPGVSPLFADFFERAFAPAASRYPNGAATFLEEVERLDAPAGA